MSQRVKFRSAQGFSTRSGGFGRDGVKRMDYCLAAALIVSAGVFVIRPFSFFSAGKTSAQQDVIHALPTKFLNLFRLNV